MDGVRLLTAGARCCLIFPNFENKLFRSNPFSSPSFLYNISGREGKGRGKGGEGRGRLRYVLARYSLSLVAIYATARLVQRMKHTERTLRRVDMFNVLL